MVEALRTPDDRFKGLPDYPFEPHYLTVDGLRIHYVDEGPRDEHPVLMMHGEPSWSYLYRKIIPKVSAAGWRVLAPDLVGFGKSDKPVRREDYTYQRHLDWMWSVVGQLGLDRIVLVCHDWGGLLGLRMVGEHPDRFDAVLASNTFLPTGDMDPGEGFKKWQKFSQEAKEFEIGRILKNGTARGLPPEIIAAYDAPFPDDRYKAGARQFPMLVPIRPDDPASESNRAAWQSLSKWEKLFVTVFADSDPVTKGGDKFLQMAIPGTKGQPHSRLARTGHFIQEDDPDGFANCVLEFLKRIK